MDLNRNGSAAFSFSWSVTKDMKDATRRDDKVRGEFGDVRT